MEIKRQLTTELASIVKVAVRENRAEHVDVLPSDILNSVCNVIEAIFVHGLKESKGGAAGANSAKAAKMKKMTKSSYPEPNFWPFLEKFTHRNIRAQIGNLNQIKTDIGRGRVWIRISLNDKVLENYMSSILREQQIVKHFYHQRAYLRDTEQCDLMLNYMRALAKLTFKAPLNSSILNEWTPTPLKMAGLLNERRTPSHNLSGASGMLDMEDVMEEDNDVAVGVSALEYDGLDDPSFSDTMSDVRSESQFSIQSRPVAAYGDRRMIFSPDGDDHSGSDCYLQDSSMGSLGLGGGGGIGAGRANRKGGGGAGGGGTDLGQIYESMTGDEEAEKLDAVLCSITGTNLEDDDKNPFSDSGVATSPPIESNVVVVHRQSKKGGTDGAAGAHSMASNVHVESSSSLETKVTTEDVENRPPSELREQIVHEGKLGSSSEIDRREATKIDASLEQEPTLVEGRPKSEPREDTAPKPIVDVLAEERRFLEQLEMSFSPGNSLAAHGWSSPTFELGPGTNSPSTSSLKSTPAAVERPVSSSLGNSAGFAALFSAVMKSSSVPKCSSAGATPGTSPPKIGEEEEAKETTDNMKEVGEEPKKEQQRSNEEVRVLVLSDGNNTTGVKAVDVSVVTERRSSKGSSSSLSDNFVLVEESQESLDHAAAQKTFRLSLLAKFAEDAGLDVQGFKCNTCQRTIGLPLFGAYRVCSYDGHYYCGECHLNDEKVIPARVVLNWDFKPRPVSRASKAFLDHVADQPLIDLQKFNPSLSDVVKAVNETRTLRLQLSYVAMYLLSCKESVADDLRKRVWPKEYLYTNIDLYSVSDLMDVFNGQLQKHLRSVIQYAVKHVLQQCRLCVQKGFICELCNDPKIIYAFQMESTHRCPKCQAVYHAKCVQKQKQVTCPKCVRREMYTKQAERSSFSMDNMLPLGV